MEINGSKDSFHGPIRVGNSLYVRLFLPLIATIIAVVILLTVYSLKKLEEASTYQLRHEALLLSDALEAAITPALTGEPDIQQIQAHIERLVATRARNDIEINVMFLEGNRSAIVASNIPDNIERTDYYEHRAIVAALENREPSFFIGEDQGDASEPIYPPSHPDYYVGPGNRFVSVTNPLVVDGRDLGAINTKLSLFEIDRQIASIRKRVIVAIIFVPSIALIAMFWIVRRGLMPLNRIARKTGELGPEDLTYRFPVQGLPMELRPICARLNDLFERLQAAFDRERRFSANVAHELRTPITVLRTLCEVWLEYGEDEERRQDTRKILQDTLEIAEQMEHLVTALLALVRSESGQCRLSLEKLDLAGSVREAWASFGESAREKNLSCTLDLPKAVPVETDRELIGAILTNLFSNAVAYSPDRGSVRCVLERRDSGFQLDLENSTTDLEAGDLTHLTEPFWRKDPARTDGGHGGLGLALVSAYAGLLKLSFEVDLPQPDLFRVRLRTLPR